jgi:hypothetical protein
MSCWILHCVQYRAEGDISHDNPILKTRPSGCHLSFDRSLAELSAQIEIAGEVHALPKDGVQCLLRECDEIGAMLQALIDHRRK